MEAAAPAPAAAGGSSLAESSGSIAEFICRLSRTSLEDQEQDEVMGWREGCGKFFHRNHDPNLDDLIFYVAGSAGSTTAEALEEEETNDEMYSKALGGSDGQVFVKRRSKPDTAGVVDTSGIRSFPDSGARWRDTFCLNVLLQLRYTVTVAVGRMTADRFSAAEKVVAEAYPSISRPESVVAKGQTLYTYPLLCFTFDNFDELFQRIVVSKGQAIVFQLQVHGGSGAHLDLDRARAALAAAESDATAANGGGAAPKALRTTIFEGGVPYDRLQQGYQLRRPSIIDFRHFTNKKMAFLPMRGPGGKGRAEVGVLISDYQEGAEPEPAPAEAQGEDVLKNSFRWLSSVASEVMGAKKVPEDPSLSCFLTTLTVHWHTIWIDLMKRLAESK